MNIPGFGKLFARSSGRIPLEQSERIVLCNRSLMEGRHLLVGITRVRNESLILRDTLDYVGRHVDAIVAYDDASTDDTLEILRNHPKVALVIQNSAWQGGERARLNAETRHRGLLLQAAQSTLKFEWTYCFDADERVVGDLRTFIGGAPGSTCDGIRIRLFDAYMTPSDHAPLLRGQPLLGFRQSFGPERRDILMVWRNRPGIRFEGLDAREPVGAERIVTDFHCQHYGKAISVEQWEKTCDYYIQHFPFETYGRKWLARKANAIHVQSDFSRPLFGWGNELFEHAVVIN